MVSTRNSSKKNTTPAKKQRNKAVPLKSPTFKSPQAPPLAPSEDKTSLSSQNSRSSGGHPGIPHHIQKQLAVDIEENKGIKFYTTSKKRNYRALARTLLTQPRTQKVSTVLCDQLQKKVWHWGKLDQECIYEKNVLNCFQVKPAATLQSEKKQAPFPADDCSSSSTNSSISSCDTSSLGSSTTGLPNSLPDPLPNSSGSPHKRKTNSCTGNPSNKEPKPERKKTPLADIWTPAKGHLVVQRLSDIFLLVYQSV